METTPQSNPQSNPFATMHKQRLYSLAVAIVAFITLLLPWVSFVVVSENGLRGMGIISLLGVIAVIGSAFMGNKEQAYDAMTKNIVIGGFGAIALGAVLFLLTRNSNYGPFTSNGFGIWACLVVGLAGLGFIMGFIKIPQSK